MTGRRRPPRRLRHPLLRLRYRIGRRGSTLMFFGFLGLVYGVSLLAPSPEAAASASLRYYAEVLPLPVWGALWATVGFVSVVNAFRRVDAAGFVAVIFLKVLWGGLNLIGWLAHIGWIPADGTGLERGYVGSAVWFGMAWMIWVISGWPEVHLPPEPAAGPGG